MFKSQDNIFITYTHPSEQRKRTNRQAVSSFVSRSYRPTSRKIVFVRSNYRPFLQRSEEGSSPSASSASSKSTDPSFVNDEVVVATSLKYQAPNLLNDRPLGSPFQDPFVTYPIPSRQYLPFFIDYCEPLEEADAATTDSPPVIRHLTPRFMPALDTTTSRYLKWFNVALQHPEQFHALIALSQMYHNIDMNGFGQPHWRALYHRGESLRLLRSKVETSKAGDDDASILTALWLIDVEVRFNLLLGLPSLTS